MLLSTAEPCGKDDKVASFLGDHQFQSCSIRVTRGDYAPLMQRINENLAKAKVVLQCVFVMMMTLYQVVCVNFRVYVY